MITRTLSTQFIALSWLLSSITLSHYSFASSEEPLSVSIQIRENANYFSAIQFDSDDEQAGWFWTQRVAVDGSYSFNQHWRFQGRIISALQEGKQISPIDRNNLDLQVGFIEYSNARTTVKLGRQEAKYGAQRLLGTRDGTNVRRVWDGLIIQQRTRNDFQVDLFALQLVNVESNGTFNDTSNSNRQIFGAYGVYSGTGRELDFYFIHHSRDQAFSIEGNGKEKRSTVGLRYSSGRNRLFWEWETLYQFGELGGNDIAAWTLATNSGYKFNDAHNTVLTLSANVGSGDRKNSDGKLETLNGLYPRGNYFSEASILGPSNFYNFHPMLQFDLNPRLAMRIDSNFYWRLERTDGVYGPPGNLIQGPEASDSRFVNIALSMHMNWKITDDLKASLTYTQSRPQAFLKESGLTDTLHYGEFNLDWHF